MKEEPPTFCRSLSIPIDVIEMIGKPLDRGTKRQADKVKDRFSHTHAMLLGYVDMMVNWKGQGCWASNKLLAEKIGRSQERVRQLIRDCLKLGLLIDCGEQPVECNGKTIIRRVLETSWSRVVSGQVVTSYQPPLVTGYQHIEEEEIKSISVRHQSMPNDEFGMADLFGGNDESPAKGTSYTTFDMEQASRLWDAVSASGAPKPSARRSTWANQFRLLRVSLPTDAAEERINAAVKWYCPANLGKGSEGIPEVWCAESFRKKFMRIESAMKRAQAGKKSVLVPKSVKITPAAQKIADRALNHNWPKGSETQVPAVAQISLDNIAAFSAGMDRVEREMKTAPDSPRVRRLKRLLQKAAIEPSHYLSVWLDRVWRDVRKWAEWKGDLTRFTFRADHDWLTAEGREWATKGGDPPETWDELVAEIAKGGA